MAVRKGGPGRPPLCLPSVYDDPVIEGRRRRLMDIRVEMELSTKAFAELLACKPNNLSRMETGRAPVTETRLRLAEAVYRERMGKCRSRSKYIVNTRKASPREGMNAMNDHVYTLGYQGRNALRSALLKQIVSTSGTLVDIRYRAVSRNAEWNRRALEQELGQQYLHLAEFGNLNYRLAGMKDIELSNAEAGLEQVQWLLEAGRTPLYMMCVCMQADACHRSVVAQLLRDRLELSSEELVWPEPGQIEMPF